MIWLLAACTGSAPTPPDTPPGAATGSTADTGTTTTSTTTTALDPWVEPGTWVEPQTPEPGGSLTVRYNGSLAAAQRLVLHYGWNGWSDVAGFASEIVQNDTFWYDEVELQRGADHVFAVTLDVPADARALHYVVYDPDSGVWDNAGGRDYHASVQFPVVGPYLLWTEDLGPDRGVVVAWETGVPCLGVVEYGETPALGRTAVGDVLDTVHHVALDDLTPGAPLFYRVHDSGGNVSEVVEAALPDPTSDTIRFAALSDMQDNGESQRWAEVAPEVEALDPAFLLVPGDLPADDGPGQWWLFFDKARSLLASTPIVPAVGNHDTPTVTSNPDTSSFQRRFPMADRPWASLDVGPVHLLLLSTETVGDLAIGQTQYAFAEADLEACAPPRCAWTFAAFHIPAYNVGRRHGGEQGAVRDLTGLFDGRVDWVLTGHEHLYQRILPMRYNATLAPSGRYGRGPDDGVGYLVLPPAGNWPETEIYAETDPEGRYRDRLAFPLPAPGSTTVDSQIGFALITLDGERFQLDVYGMGSVVAPAPLTLRDSVDYTR